MSGCWRYRAERGRRKPRVEMKAQRREGKWGSPHQSHRKVCRDLQRDARKARKHHFLLLLETLSRKGEVQNILFLSLFPSSFVFLFFYFFLSLFIFWKKVYKRAQKIKQSITSFKFSLCICPTRDRTVGGAHFSSIGKVWVSNKKKVF